MCMREIVEVHVCVCVCVYIYIIYAQFSYFTSLAYFKIFIYIYFGDHHYIFRGVFYLHTHHLVSSLHTHTIRSQFIFSLAIMLCPFNIKKHNMMYISLMWFWYMPINIKISGCCWQFNFHACHLLRQFNLTS